MCTKILCSSIIDFFGEGIHSVSSCFVEKSHPHRRGLLWNSLKPSPNYFSTKQESTIHSASLLVSIDFVAFSKARKKNPLLTAKKMRHSSIAYQTFFCASESSYSSAPCANTSYFSAKKSKEKVSRANNFLVFADDSYDADNTRQLCLKKRISYAILISVIIRFNSVNIYF